MDKTKMINDFVDLEDGEDDNDDGFCFTPLSNKGNTKTTAICVEQYNQERDLNLAIMASLQSATKQETFVDLSSKDDKNYYFINVDDYDDEICVLYSKPRSPASKTRSGRKNRFKESVTENGQSSNSNNDPEFVCEICVEPKRKDESFSVKGCTHAYCNDCVLKYVASKLQDNITDIFCPVSGCQGLLEPEYCRSILPQEVFDRWGSAQCEALILGYQKFYCPFKDCSVMLIDDGSEMVRDSECPDCRRMFCAQCKVPWHSGIECEEFQKLHKDEREREDIMLMELAKNKHWRRCPKCRAYVERTQGCKFMRCRCGAHFCYGCGTTKISTSSHYCNCCRG